MLLIYKRMFERQISNLQKEYEFCIRLRRSKIVFKNDFISISNKIDK